RQMDLAEIIGGTGLHRFDGDVLGPTARQHDDWCLDAFAAYIAQQREAVSRAEHVVEERHVVRGSLHRVERLFVGRRDVHLRAAPRLAQTQEFHHHLGETWGGARRDRKSTRLNSSHDQISYAVFCLKKKKIKI